MPSSPAEQTAMQFINNMRGIAILLIIVDHSMIGPPANSGLLVLLDYLLGNGTIVFVFIAGYLFTRTTDNFRYVPYLRNKALTVVLPYLVTAFPVTVGFVAGWAPSHRWMDLDWYYSLDYVSRYVYITITGGALGPLWFIPMIVLFYGASPVFNALKKSPLLVPVFLLALVAASLIGRSSHNANTFQSFVVYAPAFLLGMVASRHEDVLSPAVPRALWLLAGYVAVEIALFPALLSLPTGIADRIGMLLNLPLAVLLMLVCKSALNRRITVLDMFARLSFFLYFIHGYFTGIMRNVVRAVFGARPMIDNPILDLSAIVLASFIVISASLTVFVALKYVTKDRSRYLIGA